MKKASKKFTLYAMLSVFVLLTLLLGIINGVNFTMAASDADRITQMISEQNGALRQGPEGMQIPETPVEGSAQSPAWNAGEKNRGRFGRQGPDSPELTKTVRYFTVTFDASFSSLTAFEISAVDQNEAVSWAQSLLTQQETGWTRSTYRYRVYTLNGKTAVTVIDQGRELTPSYRILLISVCGELLGLIVSFLTLRFVAQKLFRPLEEADRKQKRFIADAESAFKVPLTVINANTEIIERENGPSEQTGAIDRQVKKMISLVKELGSLAIYEDDAAMHTEISLSDLVSASLDAAATRFIQADITLTSEVAPGVMLTADDAAIGKLIAQLIDNAVKFGKTQAFFSLKQENGHVVLTASNDTALPDGSADQAFDRFTRLQNANGVSGAGLGLAYVKDVVKSLNGRVSANVSDGIFTMCIRF